MQAYVDARPVNRTRVAVVAPDALPARGQQSGVEAHLRAARVLVVAVGVGDTLDRQRQIALAIHCHDRDENENANNERDHGRLVVVVVHGESPECLHK